MPEIGEVARVVHYINKHLAKRTIASVVAHEDDIVYGKVGCSASAFKKAVEGCRVIGAGQQGKYFYITFDKPPHAVLHFGMTGWMKFDCEETHYYRQAKVKPEDMEWPPRFAKFLLKVNAETVDGKDMDAVEAAFVDARRLARIRLIECEADNIRKVEPLSKNGPDPIVDKDIFTLDFLTALLRKKKVPVKALLLDQGNISGIGNWVADEVMYQARLHPEQYSNTFTDEQVRQLYDAINTVCGIAVSSLADSTQFPEDWLMKYRWDKGKRDANVLPNGNKIMHLKVGGRTSAIVPAVQKKTAAVAGDVDSSEADDSSSQKRKAPKVEADTNGGAEVNDAEAAEDTPPPKKTRRKSGVTAKIEDGAAPTGSRRSSRRGVK